MTAKIGHRLKTTARYILIAFAVIFFALIASLLISLPTWRQFSKEALNGKSALETGLDAAKSKYWQDAASSFKNGKENFSGAESSLASLRSTWLPAKMGLGISALNDLGRLVRAGEIACASGQQAANLAGGLDLRAFSEGNFQDLPAEKKAAMLQSLIALEPELNGLKANLSLAAYELNNINRFGVLWPLHNRLLAAQKELAKALNLLEKGTPLIRLLPAFSGYPNPSHYLIMLQNNDELRPTGGFLGSFVRADIENFGEITKLDASDVYHLDMPSIGKVAYQPPLPLANYLKVQGWYLRDANWSPDWPQSAKLIKEMYRKEASAAGLNEPELDGVFAITPEFVADLIRLTGPITVRGETYSPENMQALLQYNVEVAYKDDDISSWDRKEIINDLISILRDKLTALPISRYSELASTLQSSMKSGDLQMYFSLPGMQTTAASLGADGAVKQVSSDYLMVVDANLAAFKSDAVMEKRISYHLEEKYRLESTVKLDYSHTGGFDWRTTRYRSYTRVLVPAGAELIAIDGLKKDETDVSSYEDVSLGKHVIGFFWSIEPGSSRSLSIRYALPNTLKQSLSDTKGYSVLVQRQPGSRIASLNIALDLKQTISTASSGKAEGRTFRWQTNLDTSQSLNIQTKD
ncbi:MAG: DUF4012 domain-containing protein [Bacillota bacterium]